MTTDHQQTRAFHTFQQLHQQQEPLCLVNVWDAASAAIVQHQGAQAIATSSASLSWSLGYADGNQLPVQELLAAIARILRVVDIPLSVDIETGYSHDPHEVARLAQELVSLGVAGINIEDGSDTPELLTEKIRQITAQVPELFINARCDVYLAQLVEPDLQFTETQKRLAQYKTAGANCLFVPGLTDIQLALNLQQKLAFPINLMAGEASDMVRFKQANIQRISVGPGSFLQAYQTLIKQASHPAVSNELSYPLLNQLLCGAS